MRKLLLVPKVFLALFLLSGPAPADPNAWFYDTWIYLTNPVPASFVVEYTVDNQYRIYFDYAQTVLFASYNYTLENSIITLEKNTSFPITRLTEDSFSMEFDEGKEVIYYRKSKYPLVALDNHQLTVNDPAVVTPAIAEDQSALYSFSAVAGTTYTIEWEENTESYIGDIAVSASNQDHSTWYSNMQGFSELEFTPYEDGIVNLYLYFDTAGTVAINVTDN